MNRLSPGLLAVMAIAGGMGALAPEPAEIDPHRPVTWTAHPDPKVRPGHVIFVQRSTEEAILVIREVLMDNLDIQRGYVVVLDDINAEILMAKLKAQPDMKGAESYGAEASATAAGMSINLVPGDPLPTTAPKVDPKVAEKELTPEGMTKMAKAAARRKRRGEKAKRDAERSEAGQRRSE